MAGNPQDTNPNFNAEVEALVRGIDSYELVQTSAYPDEMMREVVVDAARKELESRIANLSEAGKEYLRSIHDTYVKQKIAAERVAADLEVLGAEPDKHLKTRLMQIEEQGNSDVTRAASYFVDLVSDKLDETVTVTEIAEHESGDIEDEQVARSLEEQEAAGQSAKTKEQKTDAKDSVTVSLAIDSEGERGRVVLKGKRHEKQAALSMVRTPGGGRTDYSAQRIAALKLLLAEPERDFTAEDLWNGINRILGFSPEDTPSFDKDQLEKIRNYITDKTNVGWRNMPLIVHNGKRGHSSAYTVNPKMKGYIQVDISDAQIQELDVLLKGRYERMAQSAGAAATAALVEQEDTVYDALPSLEELSALLGFIDFRKETILKIVEGEEYDGLAQFIKQRASILDHIESITSNDEQLPLTSEVLRMRLEAVNKILSIIDDETLQEQAIERLESMSADEGGEAIYFIIAEIQKLDEANRRMLSDIVQLSVEQKMIEFAGTFSAGSTILGIEETFLVGDREYHLDQNGELRAEIGEEVYEYYGVPEEDSKEDQTDHDYQEEISLDDHNHDADVSLAQKAIRAIKPKAPPRTQTASNSASPKPVHEPQAATVVKKKQQAPRTREIRLQNQLDVLKRSTQHLIERGLAGGVFKVEDEKLVASAGSRHLEAVFGIKPRDIRSASENNLISEQEGTGLSVEEVLKILGHKNHSSLFSVRKHRKKAETTIRDAIDQYGA